MNTRQIGRLCEQAVSSDLQKRGAQVLAENYTCREGEIDMIAREGEYIVFVEVKARQNGVFATPAAAVTPAKQRKLILAAKRFLAQQEIEAAVRFDVAEVYFRMDGESVEIMQIIYLENAFEEEL
ncbi:MAG TPA: YraN family protein [Candidatus Aphodoplasma excrementigallinarum]|uniref:UPF0102 protein IAC74_04310 n=1 Tax=Candidatus Aphodoplasma excrementigallinarum TaxID=2840673 RepID=A0A9D1NGQ3_9FIRM|nr:YraN family protein [Candidatus Aphodoplasma excrementigallinarum]